MNNSISSLLSFVDVRRDSNYFVFESKFVDNQDAILNDVHDFLVENGFLLDCELEDVGKERKLLFIKTSSDAWRESCPLFFDMDTFWRASKKRKQLPSFFIILDDGSVVTHESPSDIISRMKIYFLWKDVFFLLADHRGGDLNQDLYIYFILSEKNARKYEINVSVGFDQLNSMSLGSDSEKVSEHLLNQLSIDDAHKKERRNVLRATFSEILDSAQDENYFAAVLASAKSLVKKYNENYDLYLHKFSVNKLLGEIEEKTSEYLFKVNESVASTQGKALAIPGALIAFGALLKYNDGLMSLLLLCFGLYSVYYLVKIANAVHFEAFDILEEQIKKSMLRYEVIKDEQDVRVGAEAAKVKLINVISNAKRRIGKIESLALIVFLLGSAYVFVEVFNGFYNVFPMIESFFLFWLSAFNCYVLEFYKYKYCVFY